MKRLLFLLIALALSTCVAAQIPAGYYDNAGGKTGDVLRAALRDIITTGHQQIPYTSTAFDIWDAYSFTDVRANGTTIWDMYSDIPSGTPAYTFTLYSDQCGTASAEGDCYSREHMFPNSWWGGTQDIQYCDLHHLPPADQYVNNKKSNNLVAETTSPTWTSTNGSQIGPCALSGFTGTVFEPIDEYKGDFARAYLYLATRYMNELSDWVNTYDYYDSQYIITTSGGNYLPWYIDMLVRWHLSDPVSTKEVNRNNAIWYNTPQHNRNPYIDHPEYVCLVWTSSQCSSLPEITNVAHTPAFPGTTSPVSISADITDDVSINSASVQWCTDGVTYGNSIPMILSGAPHYVSNASIPPQAAGTVVSYRIVAADNAANIITTGAYSYTVQKGEPSAHPATFGCGLCTGSAITVNWTDATGIVVPDGYLVKASAISLAAISDPADGIAEADGSFTKNVAPGLQATSFYGLASSTAYFFKIYPYTNSDSNINYKTGSSVMNCSCTTAVAGTGGCADDLIISEYVEGSGYTKYVEIYNNTGTAVDLSDYKLRLFANGSTTATQDLTLSGMLADQSAKVYSNPLATAYTGDTTMSAITYLNGNDALALYKISTASFVDIFGCIGEDPGVSWTSGTYSTVEHTLVRNAEINNGVSVNPAAGFPTLATEWTQYNQNTVTYLGEHTMTCGSSCALPTVQVSGLNCSVITDTSLLLSWTNGSGSARLVVLKDGAAVNGTPVAGTTYLAAAHFGGGDVLNPGEYVVYDGSGNSTLITGLTPGHTYHIAIFEYNCSAGSQLYFVPGATASTQTYSLETSSASLPAYCVTATTGAVTNIAFTATGVFSANTYSAQLSDASGSFAAPQIIGTLLSDANSGSISCTLPAGTPFGSGYRIRITSSSPAYTSAPGATFTISLYNPALNLGGDLVLCADQSVVLDAGPGYIEYEWSDGSGLQTLTVDSALIGTGTSVIIALASSLHGCVSTDTVLVTISACTGTNEPDDESSLQIWPNPAGKNLYIAFREKHEEIVQLALLDCTGRVLISKNCASPRSGQSEHFDLQALPAGVYFLKASSLRAVHEYKIIHF